MIEYKITITAHREDEQGAMIGQDLAALGFTLAGALSNANEELLNLGLTVDNISSVVIPPVYVVNEAANV